MNMSGDETALAGSLEFPFQFASGSIDGVELSVVARKIYSAAFDGRGRSDAGFGRKLPSLIASRQIYGI
jgi:hypothetical protein